MKVGLITFSEKGMQLGRRLCACFAAHGDDTTLARCENGRLELWVGEHFPADDALVFIGAAGIAVRGIAPYTKSKTSDPAVIVLDELGTFCISLLSGHLGGANDLTKDISHRIGSIPVITTATDRNGVFAVDSWARVNRLAVIHPERIKQVSAKLLAGETVRLKSAFPIAGELPKGLVMAEEACDILITYRTQNEDAVLRLIPKVVTLGIGCKSGVSAELIENAYKQTLKKADCYEAAIKRVCSIDLKANEPGLLTFCQKYELPFQTFSAEKLSSLYGSFSGSNFVKTATGVDNVCERSAVLGAGTGGKLILRKQVVNGVTVALAVEPYTVRFSEDDT